ncbi:MAG: DUF1592 domain-containing protein [Pirellula sp.]
MYRIGTQRTDNRSSTRPSMVPESYLPSFARLASIVFAMWLMSAYAPSTIASEPIVDSFAIKYCVDCHSSAEPAGGLDLSKLKTSSLSDAIGDVDTSIWERALRRLQGRQMPPVDSPRPTEAEYAQSVESISGLLDSYSTRHPKPGAPPSVRRMNRYEYQNTVRDLLGVAIRAEDWLPADESSFGFDNVTVTELPPVLLNRYITAAQEISRIALGGKQRSPGGVTLRLPADLSQDTQMPGLPLGSRGGGYIEHTFAREGQYEVQVKLARDRDEHIEGLKETHELDFLLDKARVHRITIEPPKGGDHTLVDANLIARFSIPAGTHQVAVTFPRKTGSLLEIRRQPFDASFNRHRHPRREPAVYQMTIVGPFESAAPGDSASRRMLLDGIAGVEKAGSMDLDGAKKIAKLVIERIMRRAYRRNTSDADFDSPMQFFVQAFQANESVSHRFESGIESALTAILVNPNFLFRVEQTPSNVASGANHSITDVELASRLSYFLWSSLPDDELLQTALAGKLSKEAELKSQVARMLVDPKSKALIESFADQWLYLRNLDSIHPDLRLFPDFDDNLRQAFRTETELLFESVVHEDRSVLDLILSKHTYLNERLAKHYRIPNVVGSHFRRVELDPNSHRGGLLRHGSILTVTSYATRTSPTIRGSWIMKNILGTPTPPPPPNVPALKDGEKSVSASLRERLAEHRSNPACASCHDLMDPIGFSLENYDAVGRWREFEEEQSIDVTGRLPDGSTLHGPLELEKQILQRGELFVQAMVEKLIIYSLGRVVDWSDGPEIRRIVASGQANDYRFSSLVQGIVLSKPFRMRTAP